MVKDLQSTRTRDQVAVHCSEVEVKSKEPRETCMRTVALMTLRPCTNASILISSSTTLNTEHLISTNMAEVEDTPLTILPEQAQEGMVYRFPIVYHH